jgi:hypothetical protein
MVDTNVDVGGSDDTEDSLLVCTKMNGFAFDTCTHNSTH